MHDFKSRELCSSGPCFASCFKKMNTVLDDGQQVMFGDLATEVALDIKYRIGELKSLTA